MQICRPALLCPNCSVPLTIMRERYGKPTRDSDHPFSGWKTHNTVNVVYECPQCKKRFEQIEERSNNAGSANEV